MAKDSGGGATLDVKLDVNRLLDQGGQLFKAARSNVNKDLLIGTMELPKDVDPGKKTATFIQKEQAFLFRNRADDLLKYFDLQKDDWSLRCTSIVSYNYVKYENLPQFYIEEMRTRATVTTNLIIGYDVSAKVTPLVKLSEQNDAPEGTILFEWSIEWGPHRQDNEVSYTIRGASCTPKFTPR